MLDKGKLKNEIRKLNDPTYSDFVGFPESCSLASDKWATCLFLYAENIIPPNTLLEIARANSRAVFIQLCSSNIRSLEQSVIIFTNAVTTFAQSILGGFVSSGFNGVMPTYPINLLPIFRKALDGGSAIDFAIELSDEIDAYFKTGTAININSGVTINWK